MVRDIIIVVTILAWIFFITLVALYISQVLKDRRRNDSRRSGSGSGTSGSSDRS
jgi:NADH:ubiquinone oxidoreductase subunit 3 (subunit A)